MIVLAARVGGGMLDVAMAAAAEVGLDELGDGAGEDFDDDAGDEVEGEDEGEAFDESGGPLDVVGGYWVCGWLSVSVGVRRGWVVGEEGLLLRGLGCGH